eukprot:CAMPEP_0197668100 /NCGR_PEP_ID=MMETSP1338-20131121/68254_1 /TAXON_ID=43686 ORGANISM="Pelagodinium beii, Strain RCC1491" /NCGR_SAMPLE_ID=MMETSP1338 /ASSEMBLY_ACC=CAM_ASM_000754 /LENGTH=291 /DNA_ID=CAMNT_0043247457 /DNA_START=117 /DNA_END=989 /DNA_ORIENTATION=+
MDSWKPSQLKLMEMGGNQKLQDFFREHGIPDSMPITEKYNTRAADWYRRNLQALAAGLPLPPPLPPGTGLLSMDNKKTVTESGYPPSGGERFGGQESLQSILGQPLPAQASGGLWNAVNLVGDLANKAKVAIEEKVNDAQKEGWVESVLDSAKQVTQRDVLEKTTEAIGTTAKTSISLVGSGVDWVSQQLGNLSETGNASSLHKMSSGNMQGFGSESLVSNLAPSANTNAASSSSVKSQAAVATSQDRPSYHEDMGPELPSKQPSTTSIYPESAPSKAVLDLWGADDWDEW